MEKFGEKFHKDNPEIFKTAECVYLLAFATMMCQTSIHNPAARQNNFMTCDQFKNMCKGINNGENIDPTFMETIYKTIEVDPVSLKEDDDAWMKLESSQANTFKKKQEVFMKEGAWIAKLGTEALKSISNTNFVLVNEVDPIGPMFVSVWGAMYAVFSTLIEIYNDLEIIELCIEGLMNSIKICGHFNMITERDAFVSSLAKFTGLHSRREI